MPEKEYGSLHRLAYEAREICNQQCGFCFATFQTPPEVLQQVIESSPNVDVTTTLTTDEVKSFLIDPFSEMGGEEFQFTGGDPFLRQDLPELIDYAIDEKGLRVLVDTNGMILSHRPDLFRRVIPRCTRVGIPLDAPNENSQIEMRGNNLSFKSPLRFLAMAEEIKPTVPNFPQIKVNTLVSSVNGQEVPDIVNVLEPYIREGIVTRWSLDKFLPLERGAKNKERFEISAEAYERIVLQARTRLGAKHLPDIITGNKPKTKINVIVSPQGVLYVPSGDKKDFVPKSLRNTSFKAIVTSSNFDQRNSSRTHPQPAMMRGLGSLRPGDTLYSGRVYDPK